MMRYIVHKKLFLNFFSVSYKFRSPRESPQDASKLGTAKSVFYRVDFGIFVQEHLRQHPFKEYVLKNMFLIWNCKFKHCKLQEYQIYIQILSCNVF